MSFSLIPDLLSAILSASLCISASDFSHVSLPNLSSPDMSNSLPSGPFFSFCPVTDPAESMKTRRDRANSLFFMIKLRLICLAVLYSVQTVIKLSTMNKQCTLKQLFLCRAALQPCYLSHLHNLHSFELCKNNNRTFRRETLIGQ